MSGGLALVTVPSGGGPGVFGTAAVVLGAGSTFTGLGSGLLNMSEGRYGNALSTFAPMGYARTATRTTDRLMRAAGISGRRADGLQFAVSANNAIVDLMLNGCQ